MGFTGFLEHSRDLQGSKWSISSLSLATASSNVSSVQGNIQRCAGAVLLGSSLWDLERMPVRSPESVQSNLISWRNAWQAEVLSHVLSHYEERNDVCMCLSLATAFGVNNESDPMLVQKVVRWSIAATGILSRLRHYVAAAQLIKRSPLAEVQSLSRRGTRFFTRCGNLTCKRVFEPTKGLDAQGRRADAVPSGSNSYRHAQPRRSTDCAKCNTRPGFCFVCGEDVLGLYVACQVCGHGGHPKHIRSWFEGGQKKCPSGCGHICVMGRVQVGEQQSGANDAKGYGSRESYANWRRFHQNRKNSPSPPEPPSPWSKIGPIYEPPSRSQNSGMVVQARRRSLSQEKPRKSSTVSTTTQIDRAP